MKTLLVLFALTAAPLAAHAEPAAEPPPIAVGTKMKCPVSGEDFTVKAKTVQLVYKGKRYAFCCPDCIGDFKKTPEKFAK
jgi:YHS domain-containing protein